MSLNQQFKADPVAFLRKYQLSVRPLDMGVSSGKLELELVQQGATGAKLRGIPKQVEGDASLTAWWLLWVKGQCTDVMLGSGPDFFFTSKMDGCQLRVIDCEGGPKVLHIDGGTKAPGEGSNTERGSEWRNDQGMQAGGEGARYRALSATDLAGNQSYGEASIHVVGMRKKGGWEFWVQESPAKVYQFHTAG